ncbi:MAG: hypothetical protein ABIG11_05060 [bacterium]
MSKANAVIKCTRCKSESHMVSDICSTCKAPLAKVCGYCGFANSVPKNYCDQCGELLILMPPPVSGKKVPASQDDSGYKDSAVFAPAPGKKDAGSPSTESGVRQSPAAPHAPALKPAAKRDIHTPAVRETSVTAAHNAAQHPRSVFDPRRLRLNAFAVAGIIGAVAAAVWFTVAPAIPRLYLTMTARKYLRQHSAGNYEGTYWMLSKAARSFTNPDEYIRFNREYYSGRQAWQFKNIKPLLVEKDAALITYQLKEGTAPWTNDYLSFTREDGTWVRPYIFNLVEMIEEAGAVGDFPQALFLSQKLHLVDPLEPRGLGYLCDTEYQMGLYDKAAESCKKTLEASQLLPVGFDRRTLLGFKLELANSLKHINRTKEALAEYTALLAEKNLLPDEKCGLLKERADSHALLSDYDAALLDWTEARNFCTPKEPEKVAFMIKCLSGNAAEQAISLAQKARLTAGAPTFMEWSKARLSGQAATDRPRITPGQSKDSWTAVHLNGAEYRVILSRTGKKAPVELLRLKADLLRNSILIEHLEGN